jgi:ribonucleoside-diphosphate reductase alpha chain
MMGEKNPRLYKTYDNGLTKKLEGRLAEIPIESGFSDNAISVLRKRYLAKNEKGIPQEDALGLFARIAANVAYPDFHYSGGDEEVTAKTAKTFYEMMVNRDFMPNSPTLMNAGRPLQQLAACFVLPIDDRMKDRGGIMMGVYDTGIIHMSGGGTGFSFSRVRRKNDFVSTTYGKASGPVSFIQMYDAATNSVNQGGFRRGANMGVLRVDHPDILEFIHAKENEGDKRYGNFNFSVALTDEFMEALRMGGHFVLRNPKDGEIYELTTKDIKKDEKTVEMGLINENERVLVVEGEDVIYQNPVHRDLRERVLEVEKKKVGRVDEKGRITLDARIVFDTITRLAWKNGEPGVLFIDEANRHNPTPELGLYEATNPCGEQPLVPYDACNLGSINVGNFVEDGEINYDRLGPVTRSVTRFLDNVIDMSKYPLSEIEETVLGNRKIGLGVMGFADLLVKLGIPYDSEEGVGIAKSLMRFIQTTAVEESETLAVERGAFPNFEKSIYADGKPRRNATVTTIAPTGTISIIAGASSGIEPLFGLSYTHKDADGQKREFGNEYFIEALEKEGINPDKVLKELASGKKLKDLEFVPEHIRRVFVTSEVIPGEWHVKMQAGFQEYTENGVSKTINFPNSASEEEVKQAYLLAPELGCKGITVYRDGSREEEVLKRDGDLEKATKYIGAKKRPESLKGETPRKQTGCGKFFITINRETNPDGSEGDLFETFGNMGKAGGCVAAQNEATGRLISFLLRIGAHPGEIASQLVGIRCDKPCGFGEKAIYSCPDALGQALSEAFYGNSVGEDIEIPYRKEIDDSVDFENLLPRGESEMVEEPLEKKVSAQEVRNNILSKESGKGSCPECGCVMRIESGCLGGTCLNQMCGYSSCE